MLYNIVWNLKFVANTCSKTILALNYIANPLMCIHKMKIKLHYMNEKFEICKMAFEV